MIAFLVGLLKRLFWSEKQASEFCRFCGAKLVRFEYPAGPGIVHEVVGCPNLHISVPGHTYRSCDVSADRR